MMRSKSGSRISLSSWSEWSRSRVWRLLSAVRMVGLAPIRASC